MISSLLLLSTILPRAEVNLDFGWRFALGPRPSALVARAWENAEGNSWQSVDWCSVDLPHDCQFEQPWERASNALRGYKSCGNAVYRKTFVADKEWKGRRVSLDFGGILVLSEIYLNGRKIAENDFGYLGFEVDVSNELEFGATNCVAVSVNAGPMLGSRWYTGAGLYRGVKLVVRDRVFVARHGVRIATRSASAGMAQIAMSVEVEGMERSFADRKVVAVLRDPNGKEAGRSSLSLPKDVRRRIVELKLPDVAIENPRLWDIESPWLYTAEVGIWEGDKLLDRVVERFGIRTVEFGHEFGFKLNGRKVFLKGMSNHHDLGALGAAAYPAEIARRMRLMKEFGFNAVRCSHNPYSREFYDLADEMGLLVIDELCDKWSGMEPKRSIAENFFETTTEWIKRSRNHPSVILWSLGNELQHDEQFSGFESYDEGVTTYKIISAVVDRWDPTRKKTVAMYPAREGGYTWRDGDRFFKNFEIPRLAKATDVASFNYNYEHYGEFFRLNPELIVFQSEAAVRDLLRPYWEMDRERTVGLSYWGAIEYWGESFGWPAKGWMNAFFGHDLHPYPAAYLIKSEFRKDEAMVRLAVHEGSEQRVWNDVLVGNVNMTENWNRKAGDRVRVVAFTNAERVELFINGRSLGVRKNDAEESNRRNMVVWDDVAWESGELVSVAYRGGNAVAQHKLETTGAPVAVEIVREGKEWKADGYDLGYFHIRFVDAKGRIVRSSDVPVSVDVSGEGRLVALDNGDHRTGELFNVKEKRPYRGRLLAIVRAGRKPGKVVVRCEAKGFKAVQLQLETTKE